jgi:hypothetical protein
LAPKKESRINNFLEGVYFLPERQVISLKLCLRILEDMGATG